MECIHDVTTSSPLSTVRPLAYFGPSGQKLPSSSLSSLSSSSSASSSMTFLSLCETHNSTQTEESSVWDTASPLSPVADIAVAGYLILVATLAICLNLTVIVISFKHRKALNHSDAFVAALAISDLGHPLLGYPMAIHASLNHGWNFGFIGCQVNGFFGFLFGVNSMTTLACMSLSRLLSIMHPNTARNHGTLIATSLILFSVLYASFWSICPLIGWGVYDLEPYHTSCTLRWDYPDRSFVTASFIGCLVVPAAVMCISYGYITFVAFRTGKRRRRWGQRPGEQSWGKQEMRLFRLAVSMCTIFVLVWSPYAIFAMIRAYATSVHIPVEYTPLAALIAKTSHVIDPILYCAFNKKFRRFIPRPKNSLNSENMYADSVPMRKLMGMSVGYSPPSGVTVSKLKYSLDELETSTTEAEKLKVESTKANGHPKGRAESGCL